MSHACRPSHGDFLELAQARCAEAGETLTPLRRQVLSLLWAQNGPAKAYDLLESLKADRAAAKPPTIYRALEFLVRLGLAHRVESLNAYIACAVGHGHAPAMVLLCSKCGAAEECDAARTTLEAADAANRRGFSLTRLMIEAQGVCAKCRELE